MDFCLSVADSRVSVSGEEEVDINHAIGDRSAEDDSPRLRWTWNGSRFHAQVDRYGLLPLYYWGNKQQFIASDNLLRLIELGAPADIDHESVGVLFRIQTLLANTTPFKAVQVVPPGGTLTWTAETGPIVTESIPEPEEVSLDRSQAVARFAELFHEAIRTRRSPDSHWLPLSGGRDSRHIFFELMRCDYAPESCVTLKFPPPRSMEDARIARTLCEALGIPHVVLGPVTNVVAAEKEKLVRTHFASLEHTGFLPLAEFLKAKQATVLFDGLGGDFLTAAAQITPEMAELVEKKQFRELSILLIRHFTKWYSAETGLSRLRPREASPASSYEATIERVHDELIRYQDFPNPLSAFYFWNRCRRNIAMCPLGLLPKTCKVQFPYLDRDVFDFLSGLPLRLIKDKKFHDEAIHAAFPEHSRLPFEDKNAQPANANSQYRTNWIAFAKIVMQLGISNKLHRGFYVAQALKGILTGEELRWTGPSPALYWLSLHECKSRPNSNRRLYEH